MKNLTIETEHIRKQTQRDTAFRTIVSYTGCASVGDVLMTRSTSAVAFSRSSASSRSRMS